MILTTLSLWLVLANGTPEHVERARILKAKLDIRTVETALEIYRLDNAVYPDEKQGLNALLKAPANSKRPGQRYLQKLPKDPWNNPYLYKPLQNIRVYSTGPNGEDEQGGGDDISTGMK